VHLASQLFDNKEEASKGGIKCSSKSRSSAARDYVIPKVRGKFTSFSNLLSYRGSHMNRWAFTAEGELTSYGKRTADELYQQHP
jgi:hypothetical protein